MKHESLQELTDSELLQIRQAPSCPLTQTKMDGELLAPFVGELKGDREAISVLTLFGPCLYHFNHNIITLNN